MDEADTPIFTTTLSSISFSYAPLVNRAFHRRPGATAPWGAVYVPCNWDFFAIVLLSQVSNIPFQFPLLPGVISQPSQRSLARSPTSGMSDSRLLSVCCEDGSSPAGLWDPVCMLRAWFVTCWPMGPCLYAARMVRHLLIYGTLSVCCEDGSSPAGLWDPVCMLRAWFVTCWPMGPCLYAARMVRHLLIYGTLSVCCEDGSSPAGLWDPVCMLRAWFVTCWPMGPCLYAARMVRHLLIYGTLSVCCEDGSSPADLWDPVCIQAPVRTFYNPLQWSPEVP